MFSLSNIITRTEICSNEIGKLIEDNMALVLAKLIILFSSCVSMGGIVVSLLQASFSRIFSCCGRPEARSEMGACASSLSTEQKKTSKFSHFY